jgi:hypothetical protein
MDFVLKTYKWMTQLAIQLGVSSDTAFLVPPFLMLLIVGLVIRALFKPSIKKKKPKTSSTPSNSKVSTPFSIDRSPTSGTGSGKTEDHRVALRHFDRINMNLKTYYSLVEGMDTPTKPCSISDVSYSGLAFITEEKIDKGSRIRLLLPNLDKKIDSKEFMVSGEIVRIKPMDKKEKKFEYGMRFFHLLRKEAELLNRVIEKFK